MTSVGFRCVIAVVAVFAAAPAIARGPLVVDDDREQCPNAEFTSIEAAVAAAEPGDKVRVCPGQYTENVVVNKPLALLGAGPDPRNRAADPTREAVVTPAAPDTYAFQLKANGVVVDGFTFRAPNGGGVRSSAAFSGYDIRKNYFVLGTSVLRFRSSGVFESSASNNFFDGPEVGIDDAPDDESGARLLNAVIRNNTFDTVAADIQLSADPFQVTIRDNLSAATGVFLVLSNAEQCVVLNNRVDGGAGPAITINRSMRVEVLHNRIHAPRAAAGIVLGAETRNVRVAYNHVTAAGGADAASGIWLDGASDNVVENNRLEENALDGIQLSRGASGNTVRENRCRSNQRDGIRSGGSPNDNRFIGNHLRLNLEHDAHDENRAANEWLNNQCDTDFPEGTICPPAP